MTEETIKINKSNDDTENTEPMSVVQFDFTTIDLGEDIEYEPILDPKNSQYTDLPIRYPSVKENYKLQMACMWKVEEIDFSKDYNDFMTCTKDEQHFLKMTLAMLAGSDGIVVFNLSERFIREVQIKEIQKAYNFQTMMEDIHGEAYSVMLDTVIKNADEKKKLFNAIETVPAVKKMSEWAIKWIDSDTSFAYRVVAFCVVEGIFFSGMFATIFWFKKYKNAGKSFMDGLINANKFIARDEGLHTDFGCLVYGLLDNKLSQSQAENIIQEGVDISKQFMKDALLCDLIGMNFGMMADYLEYISDRLLISLGHNKKYMASNPFDFMNTIGMPAKSNFFEVDPTDYQDAYINQDISNFKIEILDEF